MSKGLLALAILLSCGAYHSSAQIYVNIQPPRPHYVRVAAPAPEYVWIDEEWEPRGNTYVFVGGHWAAPPQRGHVWAAGHWSHGARGHSWTPGHWQGPRQGNGRGNGHSHSHGNGHGGGHGHGGRR